MKKQILTVAFCGLFAGAAVAHDDSCNVELNHTLKVSPEFVSVVEDTRELYRIAPDGAMAVDGESVELNTEQQERARLYAQGLRGESKEILLLVSDAVDVAVEGVAIAFDVLGIPQDDDKLTAVLNKIDQRMDESYGDPDGTYSIGPDGISEFDSLIVDPLGDELEAELEDAIAGSVFKLVWNSFKLVFADKEALEQRIEEQVAVREARIEKVAEQLEARAEGLCDAMVDLNLLEDYLRNEIPAMREHNLLRVNRSAQSGHSDVTI